MLSERNFLESNHLLLWLFAFLSAILLMKNLFLFLFVLLLSAGVFGQTYQSVEKDLGTDIVTVTAIKSNLRDFASPSAKIIASYPKETRLILVSRLETAGWFEVANIYTLEKGWMHKSTIQIYLSSLKDNCSSPTTIQSLITPKIPKPVSKTVTKSEESPFSSEYVGSNSPPTLEIENRTVKTITFTIGGVSYEIESWKTQSIPLESGTYSYSVSAPGVRGLTGTDGFENNFRYTWGFTIITRTVPR